jgi:hypothetical protein
MFTQPGASPISAGYQDPSLEVPIEDLETLHKKIAILKKALEDKEPRAKYKIELRFGKARSIHGLTPGMVSFWHSGTKFHGGGDEKMYLCPGQRLLKNGCERPLPQVSIAMGHLTCPYCGNIWRGEQGIGEIACNLYMQRWAVVMLNMFVKCEHNADLVLKFTADDIRSVTMQQASAKRERQLDTLRGKRARALHVYPLKNIIKDTSAGSDLYKRIYAFLVA